MMATDREYNFGNHMGNQCMHFGDGNGNSAVMLQCIIIVQTTSGTYDDYNTTQSNKTVHR